MLVDTHCHLDAAEFAADRDAIVAATRGRRFGAGHSGGRGGQFLRSTRLLPALHPQCYPAYGLHPLYLERAGDADLAALRRWLADELNGATPPVAVGEIGLDHHLPDYDASRQEHFFVEQLKVARDFDLPVLLHAPRRRSWVLKCLRRVGVRRGIAHAFNGSRQQADEFIRLGFKLGFGGAMTFPGSTRIRALASSLPLDAIVLETDAPDIPPCWLAGGRNTPVELPRIADTLAELRAMPSAQLRAATSANALTLLPLSARTNAVR